MKFNQQKKYMIIILAYLESDQLVLRKNIKGNLIYVDFYFKLKYLKFIDAFFLLRRVFLIVS